MTGHVATLEHTRRPALHQPATYADLILSALKCRPACTAFRWTTGTEQHSLTYLEVAQRIETLAATFSELQPDPAAGIALLCGPSAYAFIIMAAACRAGIRFTALHPLATTHDDTYILRDSNSTVLIIDSDKFAARAANAREAARVVTINDIAARAQQHIADEDDTADKHNPAYRPRDEATYLFYTGGTTGEPKGVILRDRSLVANAVASTAWPWPSATQFLLTTPMSHAAGLFIAPGLLRGATFHVHPGFDPERVFDAIENDGVTATFVVPTMLYTLLDHPRSKYADLRNLKWVLYGAAPTAPTRIIEARHRLGLILTQHYGQAEAPNALTMMDQHTHDVDDETVLSSCGRALPGVQLRLLDPNGEPVADGSIGELCVRGPLVMDGYWNKPQQTESALRGGWLHTGDLARIDSSGLISIVDRLKDMIITGGFNVYPREVEDVIQTHPAVAQCAVFGEPDPQWGEAVVASVVLHSGAACSVADLTEHVKTVKGPVWTPKRVNIVEQLPVTPLGKIDKKALRSST